MELKPFDLLFYKGKNIISHLIQSVTNSPYSHVALVLDEKHTVEIDIISRLKIRHIEYPQRDFKIYRINEDISEEQRKLILNYIFATLQSQYDYKEIFAILLYKLFKINIKRNNKNKFVCSSWINDCFKSAGIILNENDLVSPQDLITEKLHLVEN